MRTFIAKPSLKVKQHFSVKFRAAMKTLKLIFINLREAFSFESFLRL